MTDKSSDDILNELFHSLNLPLLPKDLSIKNKNKKRKRDYSSSSDGSTNKDRNYRLNEKEKTEKRRHHKSKKKKKHKKKDKKDKSNKDGSNSKKKIDSPMQDKNEIDSVNLDLKEQNTIQKKTEQENITLNQDDNKLLNTNKMNNGENPIISEKQTDGSNLINELQTPLEPDSKITVDLSNEAIEIDAIQLPNGPQHSDCQIMEVEIPIVNDEPLNKCKITPTDPFEDSQNLKDKGDNATLDVIDLPIDTIPLPQLSVSPKRVSDSTAKDNSQSSGKGKSIIIKNLKNSLVCTLAEEIQKNEDFKVQQNTLTEPNDKKTVKVEDITVDAKKSEKTEHEILADERDVEKRKHKRSSNEKSRTSKKRSRDRSRSGRRNHSYSGRRERSRSRSKDKYSRSSKRYESSSKRRSDHRSRSSSRANYKSPSRSNHKSPLRSDAKYVNHRSFQKARSRHLSGDASETELVERAKMITFEKEDSPDCVDLLRDKATRRKLLEVAKRNAVYMMKNDHLNLGGTKEVGKISGKSVEELTNFCKQLASRSDNDESDEYVDNNDSDSESQAQLFSSGRHPFLVKERPIVMNIRNAPMIKPKSNAERLFDHSKLREQFPVSSGSLHRNKVETGWVTVEKDEKKDEKVFPEVCNTEDISISDLVSTRISAMRKLQDNPKDSAAISALTTSQKTMQDWALSKQVPGQFTGTTGAKIMSQNELASGHQAWARKEQFREANPVSSHFGLKMMQMMGWSPGEGLGKHKEGTIEPLLLDVKMDKKGLHAQEEVTSRKVPIPLAKNLAGKHPVSALVELCSKRKWGLPEFHIVFDSGPDHKKNFLMKVIVNNKEYKPSTATSTKKIAKANAAAACLQALGVLPKDTAVKMQPSTTPSPFLIAPNGMTIEEMNQMPPSLIPTPAGRPPPQKWT